LLAFLGITRGQFIGLISLGVAVAAFEGFGVGLLLPVLTYVEHGGKGPQGTLAAVARASGLPPFLGLILFTFSAILARQLFRYAHQVRVETLRHRSLARLRAEGFQTFVRGQIAFMTSESQGRLVNMLTLEMDRGSTALSYLLQICESVILLGVYAIVLVIVAPWLLLAAVPAVIAVLLLVRARLRLSRSHGERVTAAQEALHVTVAERVLGIRLVKTRAREEAEARKQAAIVNELRRTLVVLAREKEALEVAVEPMMIFGAFAALYVAVTRFGMTLAGLGVVLFVLLRAVPQVKQISVASHALTALSATIDSIHRMMDRARAAEDVKGGTLLFQGLRRTIAFEGVGFAFADGDGHWVLRDVSFVLERTRLTAIVGRSGAGKSTLLDLIARLRAHGAGTIAIDDVPVEAFSVASLRAGVGIVDQHGFLFDDTVAANIAYGLPDVGRDRIVDAATRAHADEFIRALPQGYDTRVGERGLRLSAGQRQRISFARVVLQDPDVLLLDEPTSALDSESEQYIEAVLDDLRRTKAIVVVAHRLSTIKRADEILVLDEGRIVERGDHASLLARSGTYKRLFDVQIRA
jgi:ABC-type multidrug transport system fused ATPase/permease subunit